MSMRDSEHIRVLILDDDEDGAIKMGQQLFDEFGFQVTCVSFGQDALDLVADPEQGFDVALIDQVLDGLDPMDGIQVTQEIYKIDPLLPVLLFTGFDLDEEHLSAIEGGAYLYLHLRKGVDPINQLGFHCKAAVRDRARNWDLLFKEMGIALHYLEIPKILNTCALGLERLGYKRGVIYRHITGWVPVGEESPDGFRQAEPRSYLYWVRSWPEDTSRDPIDLSQPGIINGSLMRSGRSVIVCHAGDAELLVLPLHATIFLDSSKDTLLGAIILRQRPGHILQPREEQHLAGLGQQMGLALQNALAYRQLTYRRDAADQIMDTNRRVLKLDSGSENTDTILDQFAHSIAEAMQFDYVLISVIDRSTNEIDVRGVEARSLDASENARVLETRGRRIDRPEFEKLHRPEYQHQASYFIPEGCYNFDLYNGHIDRPPRVEAEPWVRHAGDLVRTEVRSAQGKIVGYISVDPGFNKRRPDENMFRTLEVFATQVAVAIENIHYQKTKEVIQKIGFEISSTSNSLAVFEMLHQQLKRLMYAEALMIGRYHAGRREIEVIYRQGSAAHDEDLPLRRSVDKGLSGYMVRTGEPILLTNGTEGFRRQHKIDQLGRAARSWMGVPLKVGGKVIGVIVLQDYDQENVYDERDLEVLSIVADQVAVALRRIELEEAKLTASHKIGHELLVAKISLTALERRILKQACELVKADWGIIFHYDEQADQLVFGSRHHRTRGLKFIQPIDAAFALPLGPRNSDPLSLTVGVARTGQTQRWGKVQGVPGYWPVVESTQSQISLPLFARVPRGRKLLGVITLESNRPNAFLQSDENALNTLSQYAALSLLREQDEKERNELIGWAVSDVSRHIIRHREIGEARSVSDELSAILHGDFIELLHGFETIRDQAALIQPAREIDLQQRSAVPLNYVILSFREKYGPLYNDPRITISTSLRLSPEHTVQANELGLQEALKILVDNAYEMLHTTIGGQIKIISDRSRAGLLLHVFNSGPPVSERVTKLVESNDDRLHSSHGLIQLKLLLKLYDATLGITLNDDQLGVQFTITFRQSAPALLPPVDHPLLLTQLHRLQRDIASHSALLFASYVHQQTPILSEMFERLATQLEHIQQRADEIQANIALKLEKGQYISLQAFLEDFVSRYKKPSVALNDTAFHHALDLDKDVTVYINEQGLRHILIILLDNAYEAIAHARAEGGARRRVRPATIELYAQSHDTVVKIQVSNTESLIKREIAEQIFEQPVSTKERDSSSEHGMGLLMARVLLKRFDGTIRLKQHRHPNSVEFIITLPIVAIGDGAV